jgi:hypothetical protein
MYILNTMNYQSPLVPTESLDLIYSAGFFDSMSMDVANVDSTPATASTDVADVDSTPANIENHSVLTICR